MIAPWNTLVLAPICSSIPFISSSNVRLSAVSEPLIGSSSSTLPAPKPVTWPCVETAYISPPAAVRQRLLEAFSFSSLDCGNSSLYRLSCMIDLTVSELSATSTSEYDRCKNLHLGFRAKHQLINDLITSSVLPYRGAMLMISLLHLPSTTSCKAFIIFSWCSATIKLRLYWALNIALV